ncbi:MAG: thymidine phosphorylase, partial [Beijerinckiaceae bacterium]|nr:thymidine phosphorylase [Beijerinckiaceae bacterium]
MSAGFELNPVNVPSPPILKARRLGVHSQQERLVFMRTDCHVCRAEGLRAHSRVLLRANGREALATLYQVDESLLGEDQAGVSERVWTDLSLNEGDALVVSHAPAIDSMSLVRGRIYGQRLAPEHFGQIMADMVAGRYTDVEIAAFVTGCAALPMDEAEVVALTRVMVDVGDRLHWNSPMVLDKHSVGGLPGNRTTPLVVAIVAAHGLTIPKTSSRAITSPAGTADTMETMAPVDLDLKAMRRVVEKEGGCIVWGGAVSLSPADDTLIRVERALDVDSEGQLIASVLSKKIAAGATHLVLDIPVGDTAKVRTPQVADMLSRRLTLVAKAFGIHAQIVASDGSQPVGRGIGPSLEARDVLAVFENRPGAPADLRRRACVLAGALLEMGGVAEAGGGARAA